MSKLSVRTEHPIAIDSIDHIHPHGTMRDNSRSAKFVAKMRSFKPDIRVLDIGCSGGGMVKDFVDAGCLALGIEGSDYSQKQGRACWPELGGTNLFTADATKPFLVYCDDQLQRFDLVTMWEFLEHIAERDLTQVLRNTWLHMDIDGQNWLAVSIATTADFDEQGHQYHQTIRPADWWRTKLTAHGFDVDEYATSFIDPHWVRGPITGEAHSFCAVLKRCCVT